MVGSRTSQTIDKVGAAKKGSMVAVEGSGISIMSDSLMAFQPAMEEPSNIVPSAKISSSIMVMSKVTCCHLPRGSVKRKSTYLMSLSLINFSTSLAVFIRVFLVLKKWPPCKGSRLDHKRRVLKSVRSHQGRFHRSGYGWPLQPWIQKSCHPRCVRSARPCE